MDQTTIAGFAERTIDGEEQVAAPEFLFKLYCRKWMFLLCVLIPAALSIAATLATPMTWVATTKILLRSSPTESVFLQDLIPDNRISLSGPVIGEIVRSLPTLAETIRRYDIKEADLYRPPSKVIFGKLAGLLPISSKSPPAPGLPGFDPETTALARTFQDSLQDGSGVSASALGSKASPVELLGKDSPVPQALSGDKLITLSVRAFNRTKVAEMTNGLAQSLIDQYYKISAEDAHRSYEFLSKLAEEAEADVGLLEQTPDAELTASAGDLRLGGGDGAIVRDDPAIARLSNDLAALQSSLGRDQQFYRDSSDRIQRQVAEIADMKRQLAGQQRIAVARQVLEQIKARRFQALNTENLYRSRLVPISIIEAAVTPSASSGTMRLVTSGITGLLIGAVLGTALVVICGLLDQRLFAPGDTERALGLPVFGWVPKLRALRRWRGSPAADRTLDRRARAGLMQILAQMEAAGIGRAGNVVAVVSASDGEGKSMMSLLVALALSRANRGKVLLVDADPLQARLSRHFGRESEAGLADAMVVARPLADIVASTGIPGLDLLAAGSAHMRENMGYYGPRMRDLLAQSGSSYDVVIVDTPAVAAGTDAIMCCVAADSVLVVVKSGATRKPQVKRALHRLREVSVRPCGVILNFRNAVLPRFIDGTV